MRMEVESGKNVKERGCLRNSSVGIPENQFRQLKRRCGGGKRNPGGGCLTLRERSVPLGKRDVWKCDKFCF